MLGAHKQQSTRCTTSQPDRGRERSCEAWGNGLSTGWSQREFVTARMRTMIGDAATEMVADQLSHLQLGVESAQGHALPCIYQESGNDLRPQATLAVTDTV